MKRSRSLALVTLCGALAALVLVRADGLWRVRAWAARAIPSPFASGSLDERFARRLFPGQAFRSGYRFHPAALLLPPPDRSERWPWPEHATGELVLRTNAEGLREDAPLQPVASGPRVLVLGDSHTQGLIPNHESFANLLEQRLADELPGIDVLNAGLAYTGPRVQLERLRYFRDIDADLVVVVFFVGNDFWDDLVFADLARGWGPPRGPRRYRERLAAAVQFAPGAVYQGLNQVYRFHNFAGEAERALALVLDSFEAIAAECAEQDSEVLVVLLPTKREVEPNDDGERFAELERILDLPPAALGLNDELGSRLLSELDAMGIDRLDPRPAMRAATQALYWRADHHLGTAGHRLLAELLEQRLRGRWR